MRAAIYARKSNDQSSVADEHRSVARQIAHARAYAERKGWTVLDEQVHQDEAISGAEFAKRPGFLRLMNAALQRPRPFDVLVMSEESRLGREAIETAYALKQLISAGVRVFFYLEDRERTLQTPTDKLLMSVTAFADELERERARQRTHDALTRKARAGHVTGGRVFGYDNVPVTGTDGERTHVDRRVNEAQAVVVRRIFELAASGLGKRRIALQLNEAGVPTPRAQRGRPMAWCPASIVEILNRDLYRGEVVWNKSQKRDAWGRTSPRPRAEAEWIRQTRDDLRIVPEALWVATHARLSRRREKYSGGPGHPPNAGRPVAGTASPYLLTGFVECGQCGGRLGVRTRAHGRRRHARMACSYYVTRGTTVCTNKTEPPLDALNELVIAAIEDEVLQLDVLKGAVTRAVALSASALVETRDDSARAREELQVLDREAERLTMLVSADVGDLPAIVNRLKAIKARRATLVTILAGEKADRRERPFDAIAEFEALQQRAADFRAALRRNPSEARRVLELLLAGRIVMTPIAGADAWRVQIPLSTRGLVDDVFCPQGVTSPTGIDRARTFVVERRLALAALRSGVNR